MNVNISDERIEIEYEDEKYDDIHGTYCEWEYAYLDKYDYFKIKEIAKELGWE